MRPGIFTSEFFITALVILGAFAALIMGRISFPEALTLVGLAVGGGLYSLGRGLAKARGEGGSVLGDSAERLARDERPKRGLFPPGAAGIAFALVVAFSGCGSWQSVARSTIGGAYEIAKTAESTGVPALHEAAMVAAKKCATAKSATCPDKDRWQRYRHELEAAIVTCYRLVLVGRAAVLVEDRSGAQNAAARALAAVSSIKGLLVTSGVLP